MVFSLAIRSALRASAPRAFAQVARPATLAMRMAQPAMVRNYSSHEETFEEFTVRFEKEFEEAYDLFEVQRVLNNCFSYDLVPAPSVLEKALQACRRVNDFPTAVRLFEGLKYKVENQSQYDEYLAELKPLREELGITLKEDLFTAEASH
ncbi:COX5A-domain-containing protein [Nadsonia fulvescens var. elongata DSM 6958]|uniref:Cytochrome c oxidase subunit 6, mitochondrial n=1 Tax=Nadsonia fulvescens var. elongata DSM 6958 TaxID=857566 RepID=A0A1E3PER3_9ASCO|nr:COX5A-domain-containing protein [Nadsonia fulvescens var. elongata DSM 6958]